MPLNAAWHKAHPMPKNATLDERVAWHLAHSAACNCRPMPNSIVAELARRRTALASSGEARKD
ncbi:MAG: hypothetical protein KIS68_02695 [Bauldia sp.]|nr:hypothetical protein [Bauldia sp.]